MLQDVTQSTDNHFTSLVLQISKLLGPGGIGSEDVDPNNLLDLMRQYKSNENDWTHFISTWEKPGEPYVRNLVDSGNGKYNLLLLVWHKGSGSCIHDHTKHCCMKILKGQLKETLYEWPDQQRINCGEPAPLAAKKETVLNENEVSYISNSIGLHSMLNTNDTDFAVSLHLYTPPAKICHKFDKDTGEASDVKLRL